MANVGRMQGFAWDNHITGSESSWGTVLGEGVEYASKPDRAPIAREARRDRVDYERLLRNSPPTLRPSLERLYALSLDPARAWAHRNDPTVIRRRPGRRSVQLTPVQPRLSTTPARTVSGRSGRR